jgi:hypothetical protein
MRYFWIAIVVYGYLFFVLAIQPRSDPMPTTAAFFCGCLLVAGVSGFVSSVGKQR